MIKADTSNRIWDWERPSYDVKPNLHFYGQEIIIALSWPTWGQCPSCNHNEDQINHIYVEEKTVILCNKNINIGYIYIMQLDIIYCTFPWIPKWPKNTIGKTFLWLWLLFFVLYLLTVHLHLHVGEEGRGIEIRNGHIIDGAYWWWLMAMQSTTRARAWW